MTTTGSSTLTLNQVIEFDDDIDHLYCCDVNTAFCGEDITDSQICTINCNKHFVCPMCEILESNEDWPCRECA